MQSAGEEKYRSVVGDLPGAREVADGVARGGNGRVRRTTCADLEAILDINDNIYDGMDYLPALFHIFMHSKEFVMYVNELEDGRLVALINFYLVPGTEDLVTIMSLRVRPSFQGQGFGRPEKNPITDQFRRDHPEVKRYIIQTHFKANIQAKIQQVKLLYHWNILRHRPIDRLCMARLPDLHPLPDPQGKPYPLSYTEGIDWLSRSDTLVNFLSRYAEDYIVSGEKWMPVQVNATELGKLFATSNVLLSFAGTKGNPAPGGVIASVDNGDMELTAFSSSSSILCKYGLNVGVNFFGDSETDLLSHVYDHVSHFVRVTQGDVRMACSVHFPLTIDCNKVRERLKEYLGYPFRQDEAVQYMDSFGP